MKADSRSNILIPRKKSEVSADCTYLKAYSKFRKYVHTIFPFRVWSLFFKDQSKYENNSVYKLFVLFSLLNRSTDSDKF